MAKQKQPRTRLQQNTGWAATYWRWIKSFFTNQWEIYQPQVATFTNYTSAAGSATSTFMLTIEVMPIAMAVITVIAAAPVLNFLVPELLFSPFFYVPAIIGISIMAGYMKYQELMERAKLDRQIHQNQLINEKLEQAVASLEKELALTQRVLHKHVKPRDKSRTLSTQDQKRSANKLKTVPQKETRPRPKRRKRY
ncbi:hypothetical protein [Candidatus Berkiella aquae]|uniref:Uncharacterized protein n=1 Tax=Candidatus Berkiella aquae TaxID=295108 RepID=A0A0Q9YIS3_9GAMM|nr:hypothetical protein [Candidatus Berkiella aquae]MCS5712211.1 hypothetical protein [Candidatus Berkiella aquae]